MMSKDKESRLFYSNPDRLSEGFLHGYIFDPEADKEPSEYKIFKSEGYTLRSWRDEFYVWRDGCYYRLSNAEIKRLIMDESTETDILKVARKYGMWTLKDDGIRRAAEGITTLEEVMRVAAGT